MAQPGKLDVIYRQIVWDRLISVVEEQAQTLVRTGFSTSTREAGDVSAGVFSREGHMLAQAVTGTPGHVNSMARAVVHFLKAFPLERLQDGDVLLTNDPWKGTGHLHDFTFVTPMFRAGRVVALFACTDTCGRHRRAGSHGGCPAGLRGRRLLSDHALCEPGRRQRDPDRHRARQCARAGAGRGRPLFTRGLQRDRLPSSRDADGRIRRSTTSTPSAPSSSNGPRRRRSP